jgi:hypothetical protein
MKLWIIVLSDTHSKYGSIKFQNVVDHHWTTVNGVLGLTLKDALQQMKPVEKIQTTAKNYILVPVVHQDVQFKTVLVSD